MYFFILSVKCVCVCVLSQFDHSNILRLLGVCVLNEPQYLILELMEGGDLRSYLRGARPSVVRRNTQTGLKYVVQL